MKRSKQLQILIAKSMDDVVSGAMSTDKASAIARLGNVEVKSVVAELNYQRHRSKKVKIDFFEDDV